MARTAAVDPLSKLRAAKAKLDLEEKRLLSKAHDKALNQITVIAQKAGLSAEQIAAAMGVTLPVTDGADGVKGRRKPGRKAGFKVPPKYRDPVNPGNTWTGRGRMPKWVAELHGRCELDHALIKAEGH